MKRQRFTLIELLLVITIIAVLAGLLTPVIMAVKGKGKETKAKAELKGIEMALSAFESQYGKLPKLEGVTANADGDVYIAPGTTANQALDASYYQLMDILTYSNHTSLTADPTDYVKEQNPKGIQFLEATPTYYGSDDTKNGFRDPWGRAYGVYLDADYDKKMNVAGAKTDKDALESGKLWIRKNFAVFSWGANKNGTNSDSSKFLRSWD